MFTNQLLFRSSVSIRATGRWQKVNMRRYNGRPLILILMALDAIALKFALAKERELPECCSWVPIKASMNSSLCNLKANTASSSSFSLRVSLLLVLAPLLNSRVRFSLSNLIASAASSSWLGIPLLLVLLSLVDTVEGLVLRLCGFWSSASRLSTDLLISRAKFSLSNLRVDAAYSSWFGISLLLVVASPLDVAEDLMLRVRTLLWNPLCGLWCSASRLFKAAAAFLASTSWGNRSWIVFQRTVFTVQDLPLLQW